MTLYPGQLSINYLGMEAAFFKGTVNIRVVKKYTCVLRIDLISITLFMKTEVLFIVPLDYETKANCYLKHKI